MIIKQLTSGEVMFNYGKEFPTLQKLPILGEYIVFEDDYKPAVIFKHAILNTSRLHLLEAVFKMRSELKLKDLRGIIASGSKAYDVIFILPLSLSVEGAEPTGSICALDGEAGYKGIDEALILSDGHHFSNEDIDRLLEGTVGRNVAVCYSQQVKRTTVLRHLAEQHNYCVAKHIYQF